MQYKKNATLTFIYDNRSTIELVSFTHTTFLLEKFSGNFTYHKDE